MLVVFTLAPLHLSLDSHFNVCSISGWGLDTSDAQGFVLPCMVHINVWDQICDSESMYPNSELSLTPHSV